MVEVAETARPACRRPSPCRAGAAQPRRAPQPFDREQALIAMNQLMGRAGAGDVDAGWPDGEGPLRRETPAVAARR